MNKYVKGFLTVLRIGVLGFLAYAAYDIYRHIGMEGILNLFDFLINGK